MKAAIIGAGAAGCFCAIELKRRVPSMQVDLYEAGSRPLAKVAITGGGRCNLTNSFEGLKSLQEAYPRGEKLLRRLFHDFDNRSVMQWFENEGVRLVTQEDQCVFPKSQDAMEIVRTLLRLCSNLGVRIHTRCRVTSISCNGSGYRIACPIGTSADFVVVTTGGSSGSPGLSFLDGLGLEMVPPVPSLFSLNIPDPSLRELMGIVTPRARASLAGTGFSAEGPLLITHWGLSGPSILKLSSYAARFLAENNYQATLHIDWTGATMDQASLKAWASSATQLRGQKQVSTSGPDYMVGRLWRHILAKAGIRADARWAELGSKSLNRLAGTILCDEYKVSGKSRFKEEFVTCGGVALSNISYNTLESTVHPGLYFAGEVLDVDAITGGFNLQAAWTTGHTVAKAIALRTQKLVTA